MSAYQQVSRTFPSATAGGALRRFVAEIAALGDAFLYPGRIVRQVEEFGALHAQADRIEATDPASAAALRQRASRILR